MDFGKILVIMQIIQEHSDDEPAECAIKTGLLAKRLEIYKDQDDTPDRIEEDLRIIFIFQVSIKCFKYSLAVVQAQSVFSLLRTGAQASDSWASSAFVNCRGRVSPK